MRAEARQNYLFGPGMVDGYGFQTKVASGLLIENNVITGNHNCAGNGAGIQAWPSAATIQGNTIGLNAAGTNAVSWAMRVTVACVRSRVLPPAP